MHLTTTLTENHAPAHLRRELPAWLREPLLHFALLGGLLFAIDALLASREDDPRVIVIDPSVDAEAVQVFKDARGREPNEEELFALRRVWLDNEVLYREGLALGLDRGDKSIRERVIFKALSVVDANVKKPAVDETGLRAWFEKNRARYDDPARYDFEEAVLSGQRSEEQVRSFAAALNSGTPGDVEAGLRVFKARPHENIVQSYGGDFAVALENSPPGEWRALPSKEGLRVMRLQAIVPARPAVFEELGGVIYQDWVDEVMAAQRSEAVKALARKYTIKVESDSP